MSFHPDRRPGEVFAYVRLDPSFDAKAFDRYVQTNHPLRFEAMPRAKLIFRANNNRDPTHRANASTAQLWIGGITTHQHATIDLERLISDKLRRYLDPSDEIWSMSFYPCTREGNVYAYVRLDPTFDVEAFERAVVAGATRAVVEQQVERPELSSRQRS
ncbi:hypothetical protein RQP46_005728 [Phenoliferia psychrophenolica]